MKRSVWAGRPRRGKGRGADGPKSGVERRIWKFSKGASLGEPSLAGFGGVVFQGEAKAGKSRRQGGAKGRKGGTRGPRFLVSQPERPGVERSPICVQPGNSGGALVDDTPPCRPISLADSQALSHDSPHGFLDMFLMECDCLFDD